MPHQDKKIDIVLTWVDGSDPAWQKEKAKFSDAKNYDDRAKRYRDWGLLPYWFRAIEAYAPWVNRIYFVTWGHVPKWLNTDHPKLKIVKHADFIPKKYLPTFSVNPIELNLHRIEGLSEQFIYLNDDVFINNPVEPTDFFVDGKPCDRAVLSVYCPWIDSQIHSICINDTAVLNQEFNFKKAIKNNRSKWFNLRYGKDLARTLWLLPCPRFPGIKHEHAQGNMLKSTYIELWEKYGDILDETSSHRFRSSHDVNQYLFKDWQIASGNFTPQRSISKFFVLTDDMSSVDKVKSMLDSKAKVLCINDSDDIEDASFQKMQKALIEIFDKKFPERSSYEN